MSVLCECLMREGREERERGSNKLLAMTLMMRNRLLFICLLRTPKPHPFSVEADVLAEGGFAQVSCLVMRGDQPVKIFWTFSPPVWASALWCQCSPISS